MPENGGKCEPGTVIDSDVTEAARDNFYLVSAHALKGTPRAPHYQILLNEADLPIKVLERFTYDLCFFYARATKIVSRPAPVYWAHRAAFIAPYYDKNYKDADGCETSSVSSGGSSKRPRDICHVLENVRKRIYYA